MALLIAIVVLGGITFFLLGPKALKGIGIICFGGALLVLLVYAGMRLSFFQEQKKNQAYEKQLRANMALVQQEISGQFYRCRMAFLKEELLKQCEMEVKLKYGPTFIQIENKLAEIENEKSIQKKQLQKLINIVTLAFLIFIGGISLQIARRYHEKYS